VKGDKKRRIADLEAHLVELTTQYNLITVGDIDAQESSVDVTRTAVRARRVTYPIEVRQQMSFELRNALDFAGLLPERSHIRRAVEQYIWNALVIIQDPSKVIEIG